MISSRRATRWYGYADVILILVVLLGIGAVKFAHISDEQRRAIELEARLEQVHEIEMDHYRRYGRFFDPRAVQYRPYLGWIRDCDCDVRLEGRKEFSVVARADFDGDGQPGAWRIDEKSPVATRLVED